MPTTDEYGNKTELRLNMGEILENREIAKRDPKVFHYGAKTKAGDVAVSGVVNQLRGIADYLRNSE